ncbi:MAG: AAA family ATPase [Phycisphaerae bacterium]
MAESRPSAIVLAGPNGAGKSTVAPAVLKDLLDIRLFVNADTIAQGLSGFDPAVAAIEASGIMLDHFRRLAAARASFAFETTLASRSYAPWIRQLIEAGYRFRLLFLWLPSADLAVARVAARVRQGGHSIPSDVIRRRYKAGIRNFFELYQPLASEWRVYDNTGKPPAIIADGCRTEVLKVINDEAWSRFITQGTREEKA